MEAGRGSAFLFFFFQAEDGIRYLVRSRGLGDVYKRQLEHPVLAEQLDGLRAATARLERVGPQRERRVARSLSLIHI